MPVNGPTVKIEENLRQIDQEKRREQRHAAQPVVYQAGVREWYMSMMTWSAPPEGNETGPTNVQLQNPTHFLMPERHESEHRLSSLRG